MNWIAKEYQNKKSNDLGRDIQQFLVNVSDSHPCCRLGGPPATPDPGPPPPTWDPQPHPDHMVGMTVGSVYLFGFALWRAERPEWHWRRCCCRRWGSLTQTLTSALIRAWMAARPRRWEGPLFSESIGLYWVKPIHSPSFRDSPFWRTGTKLLLCSHFTWKWREMDHFMWGF